MTTITATGISEISNEFAPGDLSILSTYTAGAQTATSFRLITPGDPDGGLDFVGTGFGAYSGNHPTTGTITEIHIRNGAAGGAYEADWTGLSLSVANFNTFVAGDDIAAFITAVFGGADTLTGSSFADHLLGYAGNDIIRTYSGEIASGAVLDGGSGTDTIDVHGQVDFQSGTITSIEELHMEPDETNPGLTTTMATFSSAQLGGAGLSSTLHLTGSGLDDFVFINAAAANSNIDISGFTFTAWTPFLDFVRLTGGTGANTLTGSSAGDSIDGGAGADTLVGGGGPDQFYAGPGGSADGATDNMFGGTGDDSYGVFEAGDIVHENPGEGADRVTATINYTLTANVENGALFGTALTLTGNALNNALEGNALNNTLDGGAGADVLGGELGDDTYIVDNAGDHVFESLAEGIDTVRASISYTLGDNLENLTLTGVAAINGTGNGLANTIVGNGAANVLNGGAGADVLNGGLGTDTVDYSTSAAAVTANLQSRTGAGGDAQGDTYVSIENASGSALNDLLIGNSVANTLSGNAGDDTLIGGGGADVLNGGLGADTVDYSTSAAAVVANLTSRTGSGGDAQGDTYVSIENASGSALNDVLQGNSVVNVLKGNGGDDTLIGGAGADVLNGGLGGDTVDYSTSAIAVTANLTSRTGTGGDAQGDTYVSIENAAGSAFNDVLRGNSVANTLSGNNGDDSLIGGGGADVLNGGLGADTVDYSASASAVTANLTSRTGSGGDAQGDTYVSIENATGSAFNDNLIGNSVGNVLKAGSGADTLSGGAGHDALFGGAGADHFVFASINAADSDSIADFVAVDDTIYLDNAVLTAVGANGALASTAFWSNTTGLAHDADDRVIYNTSNGQLFYDADGTGAGAAVLIATLTAHPVITASDIFII